MSDLQHLMRKVFVRLTIAFVGMGLLFFLSAGTIAYTEAWIYLAILTGAISLVTVHFLRHDPELIERRLRMKEKEPEQKVIASIGGVLYLLLLIAPGFDKRYGWSAVPFPVVLLADGVIILGYVLFIVVLMANRYASRVVEVEQNQQVISTGPYALIRHPMYLAAAIMALSTPVALGSYCAVIIAAGIPIILIARIRNEENILSNNLQGYAEYMQKVKYRLLPGLW